MPDEFVDAVLSYVAPQVAAMIELQRVTGMRCGEVTIMRGADINTAGKVWVFTPETHKTAWNGTPTASVSRSEGASRSSSHS